MHARVSTQSLREAVNRILNVVDKRNTRPILSFALFEVIDTSIILSATDLEVSAKVVIEADVEKTGTFCVNAKNLFEILKELPNKTINLSTEESENTLKIDCDEIHYSLLVYKNDDFPKLEFENKENEFELPASEVIEIVNKTSHAIASDETRIFLNGIFLQEINSKLRAVATDGHVLSLLETTVDAPSLDSLINGIIVPRKGVAELKRLTETNTSSNLKISVDDTFLYASVNEIYFLSIRLIARDYPKYQAVIPSKSAYTLNIDKDSFSDAVKRIKIMSNERSNGVRVKLESSTMTLSANHPSLGDALEKLPIDYKGKDLEIGFNAKFLVDTLSTFDDGEILLEFNNELSPMVIKSHNHPNYLGLVMPLKL